MIKAFLWTFWEKIFKLSKIMFESYHSWLNELTWPCFHRSQNTSFDASPYWTNFSRTDKRLNLLDVYHMSGMVHTGVEVCRIDLEMSGLVKQPWLQLMCCTVCLPHGHNFRWRKESLSGSEYWLVCRCWTLEIEFNKSLSLSIIRLVSYSVTTSLIYKWKV